MYVSARFVQRYIPHYVIKPLISWFWERRLLHLRIHNIHSICTTDRYTRISTYVYKQ